jgi:ATP-dependent RNA helicase DeaD
MIYGGVSMQRQIEELRDAEIVVATPGRLLDHIERRSVDLRNINMLVLDEADRMLDMGFINDVKKIISKCPEERQTLLFSATISDEIVGLSKMFLKNPVEISA